MLKTFNDFTGYCKALDGQPLQTLSKGQLFTVSVEDGNVLFIPSSSGKRRRADKTKTESVLAELAKSRDWSPGSYQSITYHASYILSVARHKLDKGTPAHA
jgi:hypothetical protein